ncbi:MAG: hypothetical protein NVSMB1_23910 [Polyangiales bacterium]
MGAEEDCWVPIRAAQRRQQYPSQRLGATISRRGLRASRRLARWAKKSSGDLHRRRALVPTRRVGGEWVPPDAIPGTI